MKHLNSLLALLALSGALTLGACCHEHHDMHDAGEHMENAGHEIGDAASDAAHATGKAIKKTGEKIEDNTGDH